MYKSKKKKLLSIFMAFALVLNLIDIPLIANASENEIVEVFNEGFSGNKNQIAAGEGWILEKNLHQQSLIKAVDILRLLHLN